MSLRYTLFGAILLALGSPALAQTAMGPAETIAAAKSGDVQGVFEFVVGSAGASGFSVYLNSATDYKDPGNLTIELHPAVINALKARFGVYPQDNMTGKRVRAKGVARRVPVGDHFQTRIVADTEDQLEILP
ncbi:hypothetical protein ACX40Y_10715 [Sphingomonas sp. RS6]